MAADNSLLQQQYNVMSQFADLSELEFSDETDANPFTHPPQPANSMKIEENPAEPKQIIHPTIPKNNNSEFDLTQFQDLTLLESSDEEEPPMTPKRAKSTIPIPNKTASNRLSEPPPVQPSSTKPNHSKAALRSTQSKTQKKGVIKRNMATSVVKSMIGVTTKINSLQSKKSNATQHENGKNTETDEKIDLRMPYKAAGAKKRAVQTENKSHKTRSLHRICPFRKVLMFAMHLHLTGAALPKWMVDVLTLFNDSNLKSCHEAASLGKTQRKLFVDTVCNFSEPDNFIYVGITESIQIDDAKKKVKYSSWAVVTVANDNTKYSELKSVDGYALHTKITNNHLMINKGVYLFFNDEYKTQYLDFFLYSKDKATILYCCDEYKVQQRAHIKKILALDFDVGNKYSEWFLRVYDTWLAHYDVNDCYEMLARNVEYWMRLILNKYAVSVQFTVDQTFTVKTMHSKQWIEDGERDYCSFSECSEKFGVVTRKHHCRSCGDIFCKNHCEKALYRRNEYLECMTKTMWYNDVGQLEGDMHWNEREMRICPDCKDKYALFVDVPHKHQFMNCQCLKWNLNQIDFDKEWRTFKAKIDIQSNNI